MYKIEDIINKVHCSDCLDFMKQMPDNSVDLIATDPPYNIGKNFANDNLPPDKYIIWCDKWIIELSRIIKVGGAIYVCSGFQYVAELKILFNKQTELRLKNWIIWYRQDGWKGNNGFCHSHEHILYFIKDNISSKQHQEFIDYLTRKREEKGLSLSDINKHFDWAITGGGCASSYMGNKEENMLPTQKHYEMLKDYLKMDNRFDFLPFGVYFNKTDVWDDVWLNPKSEKNRRGHPTQKPTKLFSRMILASSEKDAIIFDPFLGSGTTAVACKELNRNFIGIEINPEYCKISERRLANTQGSLF